jgi:Flp pilus assembly protein TadG
MTELLYNMGAPRDRQRGSAAIAIAIMMPMFVGFAALAVDIGFLWASKAQLETAAEAAALACQYGLSSSTTTATTYGIQYAGNNTVMGTPLTLSSSSFTFGNWNSAARTFSPVALPLSAGATVDSCKVSATVGSPLFFGKIFGKSTANVTSHAIAQFGSTTKAWNLVVAEDITASFSAELSSNAPQKADQALLDCLITHTGTGSFFGYVEFTNVAQTINGLQKAGTNYTTLKNSIAGTRVCNTPGHPACGGTGTDAGIIGATNLLDAAQSAGQISCAGSSQGCAIVVVTDGAPTKNLSTCTASPKDPQHCAMKAAADACAKGYAVFAIFFDNDGGGTSANVAALACGGGTYFKSPTPTDIQAGTFGVCATLPARLVYQD